MDNKITIYLAGYMTVYKEDLLLRKYGDKTEDIEPANFTRAEVIRAINKGEIHVLVSSLIQEEKFEEIALDVTEVE